MKQKIFKKEEDDEKIVDSQVKLLYLIISDCLLVNELPYKNLKAW